MPVKALLQVGRFVAGDDAGVAVDLPRVADAVADGRVGAVPAAGHRSD
ncbi:hypothetical protein IOD16_09420 [Saccharothrix sp. 6-C]|nr:hypothetical protein [Saccharothrix sp. 6-C]QQQ78645.1 hypothetical protein IOD16_09420 [Saccharothrix sp. 6-C]